MTCRPDGAEAADRNFESYLSAVPVMDRVLAYPDPYDAVVLAGFGEHGRGGLQELIKMSKLSTYAPPEPMNIIGRPLSAAPGLAGDSNAAARGPAGGAGA